MKTKLWFLLAGLAVSGLVMNGCYTQVTRPDRQDETTISREAESAEEDSVAAYSNEPSDQRHDYGRSHTDVYIYGGGWYDPWYPAWYRYPYSRFYVSVGFGYYDPFAWDGTPWDWWSYPWGGPYYAGWWPYYGWQPAYYYDPFYYPYYGSHGTAVENKKRPITRHGLAPASDQSAGTYASGGGRGSLFRPSSGTYARGTDGTYRHVRKGDASSSADGPVIYRPGYKEPVRKHGDINQTTTPRNDGSGGSQDSGRRSRKPAPSSDNGSGNHSSGSGGSVSRPYGGGSSGGGSAPRSSGGSSGGGAKRPSRH